MTDKNSFNNSEHIKKTALAREEIEGAINRLKVNFAYITPGQIKEIKRLIYSSPSEDTPFNGNGNE